MADIKWIKLYTNMFDNRKIKYIRALPQGNDILLMWIMLLITAGRCNDEGYIYLIEDIPYTEESLSEEFKLPINTIKLGLETLHRLKMLDSDSRGLKIINWEEYQNVDGMEKVRALRRQRVKKFREKQKLKALPEGKKESSNVTRNVTVTPSNGTDIDIDIDIDIDKESNKEHIRKNSSSFSCPYQKIIDLYHEITTLPRIKKLTESRKKNIRARWKENPDLSFFEQFFEKASKSDFLNGRVSSWSANLEWLMKPNNFAKVLEGNYDNRGPRNRAEAKEEANRRAAQEFLEEAGQ